MDAPDDLIITIDDVKKAGYCAGLQTRRWFVDRGFDFQAFVRGGIPAGELLATGDAHAERVVAHKLSRANG